ncbi:MAG: dimethylamine corrinoid protein 3 [Deltaproteobacteria bacterium]|nr:MAG: dimethylamine corrinoid protein 3 [Deltaproteobacteria bacterium]
MTYNNFLEQARTSIIEYDDKKATEAAKQLLSMELAPLEIMEKGFIPGIAEVGEAFGLGRLFMPELIRAAKVMEAVTQLINQNVSQMDEQHKGVVMIATVKGDVHDIGKSIVVSMLQANGFTVHDLGRDASTDKIIEEAVRHEADIIGTSALLTTTMPKQKELEAELKKQGLKDRFKTIVGGAPVTSRWAERIGADAFAKDAQEAVIQVKKLLEM